MCHPQGGYVLEHRQCRMTNVPRCCPSCRVKTARDVYTRLRSNGALHESTYISRQSMIFHAVQKAEDHQDGCAERVRHCPSWKGSIRTPSKSSFFPRLTVHWQDRGYASCVATPFRWVQTTLEVPQTQYLDRVADVPVVWQRQVPTIQTVEIPVSIVPQLMNVTVVVHRQAPESRETA